MGYLIVSIFGYLLGCSNLAYYLSKAVKKDIRQSGTGNLGASNATILLGWKAGVAVGLHDIGKSVLAVVLAKLLFPQLEHAGAAAGVMSVLGHVFPFYLKFKGGKGTASFWGMTLALNWKLALAVCVVLVVVTLVTDYIALGTLSVAATMPVGLYFVTGNLIMPLVVCVASVVMFFKHRDNIVRLRNRTEIGLRSTIKGENRIK